MSRFFRIAGVIAGAGLLAGCLVSDDPVFNETNATATPLASAKFEACNEPRSGAEDDCNVVTVTEVEGGLYRFEVEDDVIDVRFIDIGGGDYAAQFNDKGAGDYQYYWAHGTGDIFDIVMMECGALPRTLVNRLVAAGGMDVDKDYSTCTVKTADAVLNAARSYASGETTSDTILRMRPAGEQ